MNKKIYGYEIEVVLKYVLVKELQVLYGNCLFKYPKKKECTVNQIVHHRKTEGEHTFGGLLSPGTTAAE